MKKKISIIAIFSVAIVGIILGAMSFGDKDEGNSFEIDMYFPNSTGSTLVSRTQSVVCEENDRIIEEVTENLIKSAQSQKSIKAIDKDTRINYIKDQNEGIVVDFSKEFLTGDQTANTLMAYSVVKTLCQIPGVYSVKVTVDNEELLGPDGSRLSFLSGDDINLEEDTHNSDSKYISLYFYNKEEKKLSKEVRAVKITDTQPIEQYIINELVKGPENKSLSPVLSADTQVISAETTDGTCFVNFNQAFVSGNSGTDEKISIAIYSIVNSLTELDTVTNVQFLADGKKISDFGTRTDMELSFYRNENIIK